MNTIISCFKQIDSPRRPGTAYLVSGEELIWDLLERRTLDNSSWVDNETVCAQNLVVKIRSHDEKGVCLLYTGFLIYSNQIKSISMTVSLKKGKKNIKNIYINENGSADQYPFHLLHPSLLPSSTRAQDHIHIYHLSIQSPWPLLTSPPPPQRQSCRAPQWRWTRITSASCASTVELSLTQRWGRGGGGSWRLLLQRY